MKLDYYTNRILLGDCKKVMFFFPRESVDCVVTDPPYGIGFMGKNWDKALPDKRAFEQIFRVLKSGGLAFVMSSPRQDVLWRMLKMLEEVGFELRQSFVAWIYKSGFPKAYDLSLGIDKKFIRQEFIAKHGRKPTKEEMRALMKEKRETIGKRQPFGRENRTKYTSATGEIYGKYGEEFGGVSISLPASPEAKEWEGWKSITGLKPALECILMVNKPRSEKTIVDNVLKHGTGAINIDATRIPFESDKVDTRRSVAGFTAKSEIYHNKPKYKIDTTKKELPSGRFPANLLVSDRAIDAFKYFDLDKWSEHRGFLDVAKASKKERDRGLENFEGKIPRRYGKMKGVPSSIQQTPNRLYPQKNVHPTVKPVKLIAYLIELGCPKEGIVLDPYVGSGTTCIASKKLGRKYIGIEIDPEYIEIAKARLRAT